MGLTAIIPAAGEGTRLRPHTHSLPKALLPVAGKPVLAHILDPLAAVGVDRVILVLGYLGERIEAWVRGRYPALGVEVVRQTRRLGLGHAVYRALEDGDLASGPCLVVLGDTILKADFAGLVASPQHALGVMAVDDPRRFGVAVVEDGRIAELEEKPDEPRSDLALVGIYQFRDVAPLRGALAEIIRKEQRTRGEFQLTDGLAAMIAAGERLNPFPIEGWFDVGKEETWLETNRALLAGSPAPAPRPGVRFHPPVLVPASAELADCEIGPHVSLGEKVRVRGGRLADCVVGDECELTDCRLESSLIGARSNLRGLSGRCNIGEDCAAAQDAGDPKR